MICSIMFDPQPFQAKFPANVLQAAHGDWQRKREHPIGACPAMRCGRGKCELEAGRTFAVDLNEKADSDSAYCF